MGHAEWMNHRVTIDNADLAGQLEGKGVYWVVLCLIWILGPSTRVDIPATLGSDLNLCETWQHGMIVSSSNGQPTKDDFEYDT